MKIYMTSDLHVDHYLNHRVSLENYIDNALKPADVLCVAGDTCDNPSLFVEFYKSVSPRYEKIFVVFGNHDLTVGNDSYFRNNPFRETEAKLNYLKKEIKKIGNVSILDGIVEEYKGIKFGGAMAFNDWTYGMKLEHDLIPVHFIWRWHSWFDYVNWNYKGNVHASIHDYEMGKLDAVIAQKPDIILTHYIPLFFGVEPKYANSECTTYFYFDGEDYLDKLKNESIWLAGHTHGVRMKDLKQPDGRIIHLKINPVGYPDEDSGNAAAMDNFIVEK